MSNARHVFRELLGLCKSVEDFLVAMGADRRCALRLDRLADKLSGMGERIQLLRSRISAGLMTETMDADFALRESLKGLKEDIRDIRCQLAAMHRPTLSGRMQRAFARLYRIAEETYASADKLQWEIAEHDQRLGGR